MIQKVAPFKQHLPHINNQGDTPTKQKTPKCVSAIPSLQPTWDMFDGNQEEMK
jgi:hypothetical protein